MSNKSRDGNETEMSAGAAFHENIASTWAQGYAAGGFGRRLQCFIPIIKRNVASGQTWLDLGCGSGVLTKQLLAHGANVVAVDGSPRMLKEARANIGGGHATTLTWLQSDVQSLTNLADECFDGVLCSSVFEYLDRPHAALSEVARVLRPGGRLIVSVPPRRSVVRTAQKCVRKATQLFGGDKFPYLAVSKFEVKVNHVGQWLSDAGFTLARVTKFDPLLPHNLLSLLTPALLILEATRKDSAIATTDA